MPAVLDWIVDKVLLVFGIAGERLRSSLVTDHREENILGIFQAVDIADFVAIVGRDRNFPATETLVVQFDDDLSIEVEDVRHVLEIYFAHCWQAICAVTTVELSQLEAKRPVFKVR